jgi:hypothetical protein
LVNQITTLRFKRPKAEPNRHVGTRVVLAHVVAGDEQLLVLHGPQSSPLPGPIFNANAPTVTTIVVAPAAAATFARKVLTFTATITITITIATTGDGSASKSAGHPVNRLNPL